MTQVFSPPSSSTASRQEVFQYRSVACEWLEQGGIPGVPDTIKHFKNVNDIPSGVFYYYEVPVRLIVPETNSAALASNLLAIHKATDWLLRVAEKSKRPPQGYTINRLFFTFQPGVTIYSIVFWRTGMFPYYALVPEK